MSKFSLPRTLTVEDDPDKSGFYREQFSSDVIKSDWRKTTELVGVTLATDLRGSCVEMKLGEGSFRYFGRRNGFNRRAICADGRGTYDGMCSNAAMRGPADPAS